MHGILSYVDAFVQTYCTYFQLLKVLSLRVISIENEQRHGSEFLQNFVMGGKFVTPTYHLF